MGSQKRWFSRPILSTAAAAFFAASSCMAASPSLKIETFAVPAPGPGRLPTVNSIAPAEDGNIWIVEATGFELGKVSPSGTIQHFDLFATFGYNNPLETIEGPDGRMWFTMAYGYVGALAADGEIQTFQIDSDDQSFSKVAPIAVGSDKRVYFVEYDSKALTNKIGALTASGVLSEYPVATVDPAIWAMSAGTDGNIWFAESSANRIARITPSGSIVEFTLPIHDSYPTAITAGPDGNMWFIESRCFCEDSTTPSLQVVGRITPSGTITEYEVSSSRDKSFFESHEGIVAGPDGALWFTESFNNRIGRITTSGSISEYDLPTEQSVPRSIAVSKDGHLWVGSTQGAITSSTQDNLYKITIIPGTASASDVTGSWYDPNQSGQGFSLELLPGNTLLAYWYTFTPTGEATWIIATGAFDGATATLDGYQTVGSGAKFPPYFDMQNVHNQHWGSLTFSFSDCTHGQISWNADLPSYGSGTMNLTRLSQPAGVSCQ